MSIDAKARHCEEHSDEAIQETKALDCFASLAMTACDMFLSHLLNKAMPHHNDNSFHIVWRDAVHFLCATFIAAVYKLVSFFTVTSNSNRGHHA